MNKFFLIIHMNIFQNLEELEEQLLLHFIIPQS
jgi:hypothetical protein